MDTALTLVEQALDGHRGLHLPVSCTRGRCSCVRSPYLVLSGAQRIGKAGRNIPNILVMTECTILSYVNGGSGQLIVFFQSADNVGTNNFGDQVIIPLSVGQSRESIEASAVTAVQAYMVANFGAPADSVRQFGTTIEEVNDTVPPLRVGGVVKTGTYAVIAAPTVAGGAGVARFYIDSNGDGTGTAPSEVYTSSLQAVVVNTTASYLPQSMTVDTNKKYIDVKMGQLATGLAGIIPILTGAVANAANGTVVNCTVFVKK